MTKIFLNTEIEAKIDICFDLSRDIYVHKLSTLKTSEKAIAGKTCGLCELGDTITWEAKHFGIVQHLTVKITKLKKPYLFVDEMIHGAFKNMRHEHHFEENNGKTIMTDKFEYQVPFGVIGKLFDKIILENYLTKFLITRNKVLKSMAENK